jgi:hypothetical protein
VRGFSYPALSTGFGSQAFREIIGQRPHLELLHFLDQHDGARRRSDRTEGINSDERQKAMRATAQGVLRDRLAERNKIDAQRISAIADRVISIWTSPNAVAIAAGLQTQWPEGDYRRVNERIDWCVIYDEQMKRDGRLPGDTGQIISGALQAACAEAGLDYMVCNAISSRPEGLFTA